MFGHSFGFSPQIQRFIIKKKKNVIVMNFEILIFSVKVDSTNWSGLNFFDLLFGLCCQLTYTFE